MNYYIVKMALIVNQLNSCHNYWLEQ